MKNLKESEVRENIQEKYNPETMPLIFYKEIKVLKDFKSRGLTLTQGEVRRLGIYICPKDGNKLNVFMPGHPTHYTVPADVLLQYKDSYKILGLLKSKKIRKAVFFEIKGKQYRLVPVQYGSRELLPDEYLDKEYILPRAAQKLHANVEDLVCVARIFGSGDTSAVFWEVRRIGKKTGLLFFKIVAGKFQTQAYYPLDTQVTIGANSKAVLWKGVSYRMKKKKLYIE